MPEELYRPAQVLLVDIAVVIPLEAVESEEDRIVDQQIHLHVHVDLEVDAGVDIERFRRRRHETQGRDHVPGSARKSPFVVQHILSQPQIHITTRRRLVGLFGQVLFLRPLVAGIDDCIQVFHRRIARVHGHAIGVEDLAGEARVPGDHAGHFGIQRIVADAAVTAARELVEVEAVVVGAAQATV